MPRTPVPVSETIPIAMEETAVQTLLESVEPVAPGDPPPSAPASGPCPIPEPGLPRPWEATLDFATYSTANMRNGNVLTVIPIIGWSGKGPAVGMALLSQLGQRQLVP